MKVILTVSALSILGACAAPYTSESVKSLSNGTGYGSICYALESNRPGDYTSAEQLKNFELLKAEYKRRNPKISRGNLDRVAKGLVFVGMPEKYAACAWNAEMISKSVGYGQVSKQWKGGSSYFFTDHRNRVTYYST